MASNSSASGKRSAGISQKTALLWLVGLTLCYQLVYQTVMWKMLEQEASTISCHAGEHSPQCVELRMFRRWSVDLEAEEVGEDEEDFAALHAYTAEDAPSAPAVSAPPPLQAVVQATVAPAALDGVTALAPWRLEFERDLDIALEAYDASDGTTVWGTALEEQQKDLEAKLQHRRERRRIATEHASSSWGHGVGAAAPPTQSAADPKMAGVTSADASDGITAWAADLQALQQRFEERLQSLLGSPGHQGHRIVIKEKPLLQQISDLGREMCEDPLRRNRTVCAQFLVASRGEAVGSAVKNHVSTATRMQRSAAFMTRLSETQMADFNRRFASLHERQRKWEAMAADEMADFTRQLCSDPARRDYAACAPFRGASAAGAVVRAVEASESEPTVAPRPPALRGFVQARSGIALRWPAVRAWAGNAPSHTAEPLPSPKHAELRSAHWEGMIPKVACIAAVPSGLGKAADSAVRDFIHNFQEQLYEGPRELVLVYHAQDTALAEVLKLHADGTYIRAVAARGALADYPSATALRYGAWVAKDADVMARWDFETWHHPSRLSMQVRALGVTSRPASLLSHWTVLDDNNRASIVASGVDWEASLVGEASWMREHWHPFLAEERAVLRGGQAHQLVQLDMPELSVSHVGTQDWGSVLRRFRGEV